MRDVLRARWMTRGGATMVGVMVLATLAQQSPTSAATTNPYTGSGYDTSYPQCTASSAPGGFAIIGVGHGRPFTANTCAGAEWAQAGSTGSLYFNTGYALAYAQSETPNCATASLSVPTGAKGHQNSALQEAWAIGCSEADYALANAPSNPSTPTVWWADVETGNSWSKNTALNQFTITGMVEELHLKASSVPVGVYSSPSMWDRIVGTSYVNPYISANWQTGLTTCTSSTLGFTQIATNSFAPVWLAQSGSTTVGGVVYDADTAC